MISGLVAYYFGWIYVRGRAASPSLLYVWFTFWASERRIAIRRDMNESDTEAHSKAVDSLLNYETVKYFGNEELEARRFDSSMARYEKAAIRTYTSLGLLNTGQAVIFTLGMVACMLLAARDVTSGVLTVGGFVMINAILMQLYLPLNFMGMVYREIKQGLIDIETMFALLHEPAEIVDRPGAKPLRVKKGEIKFENVSFAYDPERPILKNVSFEVPAGKMVAIVGPSGAGKSTISRILFRFYELSGGRVLIDGQNIRDVTQASLQRGDRHGAAGHRAVQRHDRVQHPLRQARCEPGRGARGGAARPDRRLHHDAAARLSLAGRRARPETVRRREAAGGDRPHHPQGAADPDARRGDLGARQPYRARDPGRARTGGARAHEPGHRPPPVHRGACRQHHRARSRARSSSRARIPSCWPKAASMRACGPASARPTRRASGWRRRSKRTRCRNRARPSVSKTRRWPRHDVSHRPRMNDRHGLLDTHSRRVCAHPSRRLQIRRRRGARHADSVRAGAAARLARRHRHGVVRLFLPRSGARDPGARRAWW